SGDPGDGDEEVPVLPVPAEAQVRALGAGGGGQGDWSWINPRPQAMPTWYDVAVAGVNRVAMVGHAGQAARYESEGLYFWPTDTTETLHGVEWYGPREAVAVGNRGTIRVLGLDGPPRTLESSTEADLRDVTVVASADGWIVGDEGTLLRLAAYAVTAVPSGATADLLDLFDAGDTVWVAGDDGTILRVSNDGVTAEVSGTDRTLRAIGGCPGGALYAAGDDGKLLRHRGGAWAPVRHELRENLTAIGCDGDRAVITGSRGGVLLALGGQTVILESGIEKALHGVAGAHDAPTWVVGDGGRLFNVADDHLLALTDGPTAPFWDIAALSGALVAVGDWGRIVRERETGFDIADSPTDDALASLAILSPSELLAVGDRGTLVMIRHDGAEHIDSPTEASLRSVVAAAGSVLAVGTGGVVVRGQVGSLTASRVADAATLWDVDGVPSDAIAVGDDGLILAIDDHRSQRIPCAVEASLRAVLRTGAEAWAVGTGATIVRIAGAVCEVQRGPTAGMPILNDIGIGPSGRPMAVGNLGLAIERGPDGEWTSVGLSVGRANLRAIRRIDRHVYVVGAGGVILRSIIADGT
ncbi:MAG: hypothetical protein JRH11_28150, partial [Deltaproteobacteria bacterium]|nr:hypothetical protein [Deltaproteobacteria bacterium]